IRGCFIPVAIIALGACSAVALAGNDTTVATGPNIGSMEVTPKNQRNNARDKKINIKISAPTLDMSVSPEHLDGLTSFGLHPGAHASPAKGATPMIEPLKPLNTPAPIYPAAEYKDRISATVKIAFTVQPNGRTADIDVLTPGAPAAFRKAARDAVSRWTFRPYTINGQPRAQRVQQTIAFNPPAAPVRASRPAPQERSTGGSGPKLKTGPAPVPVHLVPPEYPIEAARRHVNGYVIVGFTVNASGRTQDIQIVASEPRHIFDDAARKAVEQWRFQPYRIDGKPASTRIEQKISFNLNGS
ncbi:MAG TPA: energy transducer TonB, partial [Gammaproteobacteria bacterium]|nr:energy transducer TonB [Gammaproteobacteria bacterium]